MINVNQITSQLAKMPDQALQQYAAMHKNDPYTVALALAESNRRKEIRAGAQMQGAAQQPKVVDQDIASMAAQPLPEDVGIAQLPAHNIQGMAGGGIVAFEKGGEIEGYAGNGPTQLINAAPSTDTEFGIPGLVTGQSFSPQAGQQEMTWLQRKRQETIDKMNKGLPVSPQEAAFVRMFGSGAPQAATAGNTTPTNAAPAPTYDAATQNKGAQILAGMRDQAAAAPTGGIDKLVPEQKQPAPAGAGIGGGYDKQFLSELSKGEVSKADRLKEVADIDKPVLEKMSALIDENKNKLKTEKEQNFYMSLIQGGLAAAGASGPNALQNLAQGFEKGAAGYSEGLKDLRKAAQENSKMEMAMAQYEASGKKDALKSYYDHQDKMLAARTQGLSNIYGHMISAAGQVSAAGAGANAQRNLMEALGNAEEGSALRKGFEMTKQEARIPMMYEAYVKAATDPMKGDDFLKKYPTFDVYRAGMGGVGTGQFITIPNGAAPSTAVRARQN